VKAILKDAVETQNEIMKEQVAENLSN